MSWEFISSHCISIFTIHAESSPTVTNSPTLSTFYNSFHSSNQKLQNVWSTPSRLGNSKSRQNTAARIDVDCCSVQIWTLIITRLLHSHTPLILITSHHYQQASFHRLHMAVTATTRQGSHSYPGPKFTDDLRTILRQFSDLQQSCDNWRIHRTFTAVLRPIL